MRRFLLPLATFVAVACLGVLAPVEAQQAAAPGATAAVTSRDSLADEAPFLAENNAAMNKMMAGMAVKPTGDVDHDFAAMMVPHHQGAIDMALAELRYGHNEQLRRIAQEIIVEQQQEIAAMRLALGQPLPPSTRRVNAGRCPTLSAGPAPTLPFTPMQMKMKQELTVMKRSLCYTAVLLALARCSLQRCRLSPGRRPGAAGAGHPDQPSRPRLCRRAILQHGVGHRSGRQQAARRHPARRPAAGQFQPALQGPGAGARHGLFARSQDARRGLHRLELGHLHRHRDQRGEAHHLCRPLAA